MLRVAAAVVVVLIAVGLYIVVNQLSPIKPEVRWLPELPTLDPVNRKLLPAEHLFNSQLVGPEAFAVDPSNKFIYTGIN